MKKFAFAAAALLATAATPAFAQDGATVYVGPVVGYDNVKISDGTDSESDDGILYGITAGVDFDLGPGMFAGLEAELTDSGVGESIDDVLVAGDRVSLEAGRNIYVGARLGAAVGSAKVYVKGGYANGKIEGSYDDTVTVVSDSDELDGWVLGTGAQFDVSPFVLRLEYRYTDYNDLEAFGVNTGLNVSRHQVVAGALFAF